MSSFQLDTYLGSLFVNDIEEALGIPAGESYLISNGRLVSRCDPLEHGQKYYIFPRVLGGKGGFGSMLRAIGAQIEKTTSREACRDLSGRRIRDVNNEKKLKEWWVTKQAERERERAEREERRRAKRAKYLEEKVPKMNDPEYDAQYSEIMRRSEEAIQEGLVRMKEGKLVRKRKAESSSCGALDKYDRWNMMGGLNPDDLDSDSGSESGEGCSSSSPGMSALPEEPGASSSSSPSSSSQDGPSSSRASAPSATTTSSAECCEHGDGPPRKVARLEASVSGVETASEKEGEASATQCEAPEKTSASQKEEETSQNTASSSSGAVPTPVEPSEPIDLDQYSQPEELQALGMDHLKMDLMRRGLKCGGSLEERAQRLFSVKGLLPEDIPAKLLAKGKGQGKSSRK